MFKKILVPVDGSEGSWRALDTAVELGKKFGAFFSAAQEMSHQAFSSLEMRYVCMV